MKILLIAPPFSEKSKGQLETYPPLGIMQLGSYLREKGETSKILDLSHQKKFTQKLHQVLSLFTPDVVGISSIIASYRNSLKVAREIKKFHPSIKVILGGIYPTFGDKDILKESKDIDVIVRGEGELTLAELITAWKQKQDWHKINGISFKQNGRAIRNPDRELIKDLNILPPLDYTELDTLDYYRKKGKFLMVTSRGCPYKCTFCSTSNYWRHIWRAKSASRVVTEFEQLGKLGAKNILVGDDLFILDKKRILDICQGIIDKNLKVSWRCSCRTNLVDKDILKMLKAAGCDSIFVGGESGNQGTLDRIDKVQKVEDIIRTRQWCREIGIKLVISFILGFPWESKDEIRDTINLAEKIQAEETVWFMFHTDIGSPIYEAGERGSGESYDPDKCLDSIGSNTRTQYLNLEELEGLYLEAVLATS